MRLLSTPFIKYIVCFFAVNVAQKDFTFFLCTLYAVKLTLPDKHACVYMYGSQLVTKEDFLNLC